MLFKVTSYKLTVHQKTMLILQSGSIARNREQLIGADQIDSVFVNEVCNASPIQIVFPFSVETHVFLLLKNPLIQHQFKQLTQPLFSSANLQL